MDWLVGPARDVQCLVGNRKLRDVSVEDTVCCSIRHEGGCLAGYYVCQGQAPEETSLTVHCENGSVRADLSQQRVGEFRPGDAEWTWTQFGPAERDEIYVRQAKAFLDATTGIPDQACTLGEAVHSLNVNIAALESARSGRCITV
jgi:predicted dehydrogenase